MKDLAETIKSLTDEQIAELNNHLEGSRIHPLATCAPGYYRNSKGVCVLDVGQP